MKSNNDGLLLEVDTSQWTPEDWWNHYQTLSLPALKQVVGQSMGMSTAGKKADLLERILDRMTDPNWKPVTS